MAHQAGAYPGFRGMKRLQYFYSLLDGMEVHSRVTHSSKFAGAHSYTCTNHLATAPPVTTKRQRVELFEAYMCCCSICMLELFPVLVISLLFCPESFTLEGNAALFIDGFALVAAIGKLQKRRFSVALRAAT